MKPVALIVVLLIGTFCVGQKVGGAEADLGKQSYLQYCSSCHGQQGLGNGPVSRYLNVKVPDLSLIKRKNNGVYPLEHVIAAIDGSRELRGHGDRQMPVWGEIFRIEKERNPAQLGPLKAKLIAEYIATLQK